jgi:hypothetical protein
MVKPTVNRPGFEEIGARVLRGQWFLGILSIAIVGVLILATWPWCFNRFVLKVNTRFIEISASTPGTHQISVTWPKDREIQVLGADADGLPPELAALRSSVVTVRLLASSATLQSISLPSDGGLIVRTTSEGRGDIGALNGTTIVLSLRGAIEQVNDNGQHSKIADIKRATLWEIRPATRNSPARIVLPRDAAPISLYNQPVGDFRFAPPRPAGVDLRTFQSEILNGELQILDTATKAELQPRELILVEGGSRMLSRLELADGVLAVDMSGEADRISVGPPRPGIPFRLDRNLTPSVLSYLLGQHELKLLWGVALTVLGALWRAREWAPSWRK